MGSQTFTDDPKVAGVTNIKAVHLQELKDAINEWHQYYSLSAPVSATFSNVISASVMNNIINGLNSIRSHKTNTCSSDTWTTITTVSAGGTITSLNFNDITNNIKIAQDKYCYSCDSGSAGYGYTCTCYNPTCYNYTSPSCGIYNAERPCNVCDYPNCLNYCRDSCNAWPGGCYNCYTGYKPGQPCNPCNACYNDGQYCSGCYSSYSGGSGCANTTPTCTKCYSSSNRWPYS